MPEPNKPEVPAVSIFTPPDNLPPPVKPTAVTLPGGIPNDAAFVEQMIRQGDADIAAAAEKAGVKEEPDLSSEEWDILEQLLENNFASKEVSLFDGKIKVRFKTLVNKEHTSLSALIRDQATKDNLSEIEINTLMSKGTLALSMMYLKTPKTSTTFEECDLQKRLTILEGYTTFLTDVLIGEYNKFNAYISRLMGAANFVKK